LESLLEIQGRLSDLVEVHKFILDEDKFKQIVEAHCNVKQFGFIDTKWLPFSALFSVSPDTEFETRDLIFDGSTTLTHDILESMAKGFSVNASFKDILKRVKIHDCELEKEKVEKIFSDQGFELEQVCDTEKW
jgi:hypothetical protein